MSKSNKTKSDQLQMKFGTASHRLRRKVMLYLLNEAGLNNCYRCQEKITSEDEFSIDHKKDWLHSNDPIGLFFSLDNIAYSHKNCNLVAALKKRKKGRGVTKYKKGHKEKPYRARHWNDHKEIYLGMFATEEAALQAVAEAEKATAA